MLLLLRLILLLPSCLRLRVRVVSDRYFLDVVPHDEQQLEKLELHDESDCA